VARSPARLALRSRNRSGGTITADIATSQQAAEETWSSEFLEGPSRTRWTDLPVQAGDAAPDITLPDITLPDTSGKVRRLSEWWDEGPVHLVFMRHYGCGCLADRWEELLDFPPTGVLLGAIAAAKL